MSVSWLQIRPWLVLVYSLVAVGSQSLHVHEEHQVEALETLAGGDHHCDASKEHADGGLAPENFAFSDDCFACQFQVENAATVYVSFWLIEVHSEAIGGTRLFLKSSAACLTIRVRAPPFC